MRLCLFLSLLHLSSPLPLIIFHGVINVASDGSFRQICSIDHNDHNDVNVHSATRQNYINSRFCTPLSLFLDGSLFTYLPKNIFTVLCFVNMLLNYEIHIGFLYSTN